MIRLPRRMVVIESPFRATETYTQEQNLLYLKHCIADSVSKLENPYASHALLPLALDDGVPADRQDGIESGWQWGAHAELVAVYSDLGVTPGMSESIKHYKEAGKPVEWRRIRPEIVRDIVRMGL